MNKCVVIGASSDAIHAIQVAHENGLYVYGLDGNPNAKGLAICDERFVVDISDYTAVEKVVGTILPDFVLPVPIGRFLTTTGFINDKFKLPGITEQAAVLSTDKHLFHCHLQKYGLRDITHCLLKSPAYLNENDSETYNIPFPVIIKPRYGSGSRNVYYCKDRQELKRTLRNLQSENEDFVLEQAVQGDEYSADGAVVNGELIITLLRKKIITPEPVRQPLASFSVTDQPDEIDLKHRVYAKLKKVCSCLGYDNCLLNADMIINTNDIFIIEISPRPSGHNISSIFIPSSTETDLLDEYIKFVLGKNHCFQPVKTRTQMIRFFDFEKVIISTIPETRLINSVINSRLISWQCNIKPGDFMEPVINGHSIMDRGYFILEGTSQEMLLKDSHAILQIFKKTEIPDETRTRYEFLKGKDPELATLLLQETKKQMRTIGLIASENVASPMSVCLEGSLFTNKNTEGYPGKRYAGGTKIEDEIECIAIERLKQLFGCEHANLQSGNATIANSSVFMGLLSPDSPEKVLSMSLDAGGHLSHGAAFHFSGRFYNIIQYGVSRETERIDLDEVRKLARIQKPKIIICGASSYPRLIDYEGFRKIADEIGAYLWVDAAHIIGLVAGKAIPSPVPYADIVTFSTQKTLRGPRGCGVILCKKELKHTIDRGVFPGMQGGPKADMIAARAVLFRECMSERYQIYQKEVIKNARALAEGCMEAGLKLVTGGTDIHMALIKIPDCIDSGKEAELLLESVGIITNKNVIPFDQRSSNQTSGIRIGSPLMTTRGADENDMKKIGVMVGNVLLNKNNAKLLERTRQEVLDITSKYKLFSNKWTE